MRTTGFAPIFHAVSALVAWAAHLLVIYGAQATACVAGLAETPVLGTALVPAMVLGATVLALAVVGWVGLRAWGRLPAGAAPRDGRDPSAFLARFTLAAALVSALAIVWETVPLFYLPFCD